MTDEVVTVAERPRERAATEPGGRLGHFQLLEIIGEGGMGAVHSAYDLRLDRKVAIKLLHPALSDYETDILAQRLLREAQAMAKLSHPNVVPIYEVGVADDGAVFIAMEYVAGKTLGKWLADKPPLAAILDVFAQAARGLAAAHEAGIVHRDFKPGNVLVDERGRARVTDFGIAQVGGASDAEHGALIFPIDTGGELTPPRSSMPLTEAGVLVGTPAYMSPEQFRGGAVDARSDQFSFCISLWEALYGKRPFAGRGKALAEAVTTGRITKSESSAKVPSWIHAILLRGLALDPAQRFTTMNDLADALSRDPRRRRRQLALAGAGALVIAGIAAGAGWRVAHNDDQACTGADVRLAGIWDADVHAALDRTFGATKLPYATSTARRVASVLDKYRSDWISMRVDACRASRVRGEQSEHVMDLRMACLDARAGELRALTSVLTSAPDPKLVSKAVDAASALTSLAGCADTAALLGPGATPTDPAERDRRAKLRQRIDVLAAQYRLGRYRESLAAAQVLARDVARSTDPQLKAEALWLLGQLQTSAGDLKAAESTLGAALGHARATSNADLFVAIATELVTTLGQGGISNSREAMGVVRVARTMLGDVHDPTLPIRLYVAEADDLLLLAHKPEALALLREAAELTRKTLGADHVLMFRVQSVLAPALTANNLHDEAIATYDVLIAGRTRTLGALHPNTLAARVDRCQALSEREQLERAMACYAQTIPDADRILGASNRSVLIARHYWGGALIKQKKYAEARRIFQEAFEHIPEEAWTGQWFVAIDIVRMLGETDLLLGDYSAALAHCTRARDITPKSDHTEGLFDACINKARAHLD